MDATTATYDVTFTDAACTPVAPVAPTVTQATCTNGVVTAPTIGLATTPGLAYTADPAGPYDPAVDTHVVVTATVLDGFGWEDAAGPSGFARQAAPPSPSGAARGLDVGESDGGDVRRRASRRSHRARGPRGRHHP